MLRPFLFLLLSASGFQTMMASSATWSSTGTGNWNTAANWTPATVPNGAADIATFETGNVRNVFVSSPTEVDSIVFPADAVTFSIGASGLKLSGQGIVNASPGEFFSVGGQFDFSNAASAGTGGIVITTLSGFPGGAVRFFDNATAAQVQITNRGSQSDDDSGGSTQFYGSSTASQSALTNLGPGVSGGFQMGGALVFNNNSTADHASITNTGGIIKFLDATTAASSVITSTAGGPGNSTRGTIDFYNNSTAGSSTITQTPPTGGGNGPILAFHDNANAGSAQITTNGSDGGTLAFCTFGNTSSAGSGTFIVNGGISVSGFGGQIIFGDTATAANATFISNGGTASGAAGGVTSFNGNPTADHATLIANGGSNGGNGGVIRFSSFSLGGTARVEVFGNGNLDVSGENPPGIVAVGSLEGTGVVFLGAKRLQVGSTNLNTVFSGVVKDGGTFNGVGGSLTKEGTGTLVLGGANTYTGNSSVTGGSLNLSNSLALQNSTLDTGGTGIVFDSSVASHTFTFGGLAGSTDLVLKDNAMNPVTLTVGNNGSTNAFSGKLSGNGSLTKIGAGTLTLSGANTYTGSTTISAGTLSLNGSLGSGATTVGSGARLTGNGTINGPLTVSSGGIVDLDGGTLTVSNVTNNGLFILSNGAQLAGVSSFTNNGTLDIVTAGTFTPPSGFVNNGTIIDSRVVKTKTVRRSGTNLTVSIDSYTGHTYRLQKSASLNSTSFADVATAAPQQGLTSTVLSFVDASATGPKSFYRILVNP